MKKNNIQEPEIITQMNKAQETSQTKERESIGGEESLRGEAEFYREKAEQQQQFRIHKEANEQISSMIPRINKMMLNNLDNHLKNTKK